MIIASLHLVLAALLLASGVSADARTLRSIQVTRVVRIPLRPFVTFPMPLPRAVADWRESRGARCVSPDQIAAATVNGPRTVDLLLRDRTRLRARLQNDCPALDYYSGFYLKPNADGKVCADRDAVHARSGGACEIDAFRKLTPRTRR